MKKRRLTLTVPAIRELRNSLEQGRIGNWLIDVAEETGAGRVTVRYALKKRPWVVTIEARRKG